MCVESSTEKPSLRMAFLYSSGMFLRCCRRRRHGSLRRLVDEFLHYVGPHHFLAYCTLFHGASLGKHCQQGLHLENSQDGCVRLADVVGVQKILLDLCGDAAVAEG